jgi:hypothetical protein
MKSKLPFRKPDSHEQSKLPKDNIEASGKNKIHKAKADETDLQNLNDKAKEYPFSNYYKAKDNDPL